MGQTGKTFSDISDTYNPCLQRILVKRISLTRNARQLIHDASLINSVMPDVHIQGWR